MSLGDIVSGIGTAINAPVIADTNNAQAQQDALYGTTDMFGNVKRPAGSAAYETVISTPAYTIGGTTYNAAGQVINTAPAPTVTDTSTQDAINNANAIANYNASQAAQYDQGINTYTSALNRLADQLAYARGNVNTQYDTNARQLDSTYNQSRNTYDNQIQQNEQGLRTNKNVIADQQSAGLRGLMRMLGAYGAAGSSDAQFIAPQAVANLANQQRSGAYQSFGSNAQNLDTNWNNFDIQNKQSKQKLDDWKTNQLRSTEASSLSTRQDLLNKLADLQGLKAGITGGKYATAAQPYLDQANALSGQIDSLGQQVSSYDGVTPVYTAPTLSSYQTGNGVAAKVAQPTQAGDNPYLAMILNQQKKQQSNQNVN